MNVVINMKVAVSDLQPERKTETVQRLLKEVEDFLISRIDNEEDNIRFATVSGNGITDFLQIEGNMYK